MCAFPTCSESLIDENDNLIGQICHIEALNKKGQRYNRKQDKELKNDFDNLILFCPNHHKKTDDVNAYTVKILKEMKKNHEGKNKIKPFDISERVLSRIIDEIDSKLDEILYNVRLIPEVRADVKTILLALGLDSTIPPQDTKIVISESTKKEIKTIIPTMKLELVDKNKEKEVLTSTQHTLQLSNYFYHEKDYETSMKLINLVLEEDPENLQANHNKATVFSVQGKYKEALFIINKVLNKDSTLTYSLVIKGTILRRLRRYDEAIRCYDDALKINPKFDVALSSKGVALAYQKKYKQALACYVHALKIDSKNPNFWANKSISFFYFGNHTEALKCVEEALKLDSNNLTALNNKCIILDALNRSSESLPIYDKILEIDPNFAPAYNNKGALIGRMGDYGQAQLLIDKAIELDPDYLEAYSNKGEVLSLSGKLEGSLIWFDKALEIDPNDLNVLHKKLIVLDALEQIDNANKISDRILRIDEFDILALMHKASTRLYEKRYADAISACNKILKQKQSVEALIFKGKALHRLNQKNKAVLCFEHAMKLDPKHPDPVFFKALIFAEEQKTEQVLELLKSFSKLDHNYKEKIQSMSVLKYLEENSAFKKLIQ